jgi:putative endonuclease
MSNKTNTTLYTGVTADLYSRVVEHKSRKNTSSFTYRYHVTKLVYFEAFNSIEDAIYREKQIKGGSRTKKEKLIQALNPEWKGLFDVIGKW